MQIITCSIKVECKDNEYPDWINEKKVFESLKNWASIQFTIDRKVNIEVSGKKETLKNK